MSHPYSDNLYSYPGLGNDEDIEEVAGPQQDQEYNQNAHLHIYDFTSGPSYNSPFSPPELEEDPSIESSMTGDSKAREAARLSGRDIPDEDIYNADEQGDTTHQHQPSQINGIGYPSLPVSSSTYATPIPSAHSQPQQAAYYPHIPSQAGNSSSSNPYIPPTSGSPYVAYPQYRQSTTSSQGSSSPFHFEAPPAYTPSPTSASPTSPLTSHAASSTTYQTFPQAATPSSSSSSDSMGRPDEFTGLLQGRGPENMGGNPGDGSENVKPSWAERVKRRLPSRETVKKTLLVLIVAVLLLGIVTDSRDLEWDDLDPYPPSRPDHGRGRGGGGHNGDTSPSKPPAMQYPDLDNELNWFGRYHCGGGGGNHEQFTETHDVTFSSSKHLTINQERLEHDGDSHHYDTYVQVQGEVILRRSGKDTPEPSIIVLDVILNDDRIPISTDWNPNDQVFTIKTPDGLNTGERNLKLCATVKLTVWVPEDAELNYLQITTIHLGVQLLDNLSLTVNTLAKIDAVASNIISAFSGSSSSTKDLRLRKEKTPPSDTSPDSFAFHPRKCEAGTTSGQIYGVWPLHDSLTLKSTSGDIRVGIEPQENRDKDSQATTAELSIRSASGDVDFREHGVPSSQLPKRDYLLDVHTTSGNVHALAAFGSSSATVKSTSGTLKLELLPVLKSDDDSHPVEVSTSSTSGNTYITILDPLYFSSPSSSSPAPALRNIHNQHTSTSGAYHLSLPSVWEGEIVMTSLSGKLGVAGKDVKLIKSGEKWPGFNKELVARKGEVGGDKGEGSRVRVGLTSGNGEVKVGL